MWRVKACSWICLSVWRLVALRQYGTNGPLKSTLSRHLLCECVHMGIHFFLPHIYLVRGRLNKMPASASTATTASIKSSGNARLRVEPEDATSPLIEVKEHDFFWTYTEEPHRSRRQAIIKAHPEERLP